MDILIHLGRLPDGERRIFEICELVDYDGQEYRIHPLFQYRRSEGEGTLQAAERLTGTERLKDYGEMERYEHAMEAFDP